MSWAWAYPVNNFLPRWRLLIGLTRFFLAQSAAETLGFCWQGRQPHAGSDQKVLYSSFDFPALATISSTACL